MKKLAIAVVLMLVVLLSFSNVYARGIGVKGGYTIMQGKYADWKLDNAMNFGIYFEAGSFLFDKLIFMPGIDYFTLKGNTDYADVWGIHLDWYWMFLGKAKIAPFLGFGPALNYYQFKGNEVEDSDAGVELFGGCTFEITGPLELMLEARYCFHDIADFDYKVIKLNVGVLYKF